MEAIAKLLSDELRAVILALPEHLQSAVPEQLKHDTSLAGDEMNTPPEVD